MIGGLFGAADASDLGTPASAERPRLHAEPRDDGIRREIQLKK